MEEAFPPSSLFPQPAPAMKSAVFDANPKQNLSFDVKEKIVKLVVSSIKDDPVEERSIDNLVEERSIDNLVEEHPVEERSIDLTYDPVEEGSIDHDLVKKRSIDLIHDLVEEILKRLPVKSLLQCRKVCQSWRANIDDCGFVNLHLKQASNWHLVCSDLSQRVYIFSGKSLSMSEKKIPFAAEDNLYALVGSCNGLICVAERSRWMYLGQMYLWNLFTGEYKEIGSYRLEDKILISIRSSVGFCFHPESKDYKIVMIVRSTDIECEIMIYSLNTDSWRSLKCKVPDEVPAFCDSSLPTVCLNGNIYWFFPKRRAKSLVFFNLTKEVFDEMAISEEIFSGGEIVAISIVKDLLAVCTIHKEATGQHSACSVWVKDRPESWTLWYPFSVDRRVKGFDGFMRNGELLMVKNDNGRISWNPVNNQLTDYQPLKVKSNLIPVIESLVSFKTSFKTSDEMPPHLSCLSLQI